MTIYDPDIIYLRWYAASQFGVDSGSYQANADRIIDQHYSQLVQRSAQVRLNP